MAQAIYKASDLPDSAIEASTAFARDHLEAARALIGEGEDDNLVIVLPHADHNHNDWRRTLARDLARAHAPARVSVVAGTGEPLKATLAYLDRAKGVTGHYLQTDE